MDGLEGQIDDVANAESDDKGFGGGHVCESPEAKDDQVQEETAHGDSQEVLYKGTRVFVEAFHYYIVLNAGDDGEVERQEGQDGLIVLRAKPQRAKRGQHQEECDND